MKYDSSNSKDSAQDLVVERRFDAARLGISAAYLLVGYGIFSVVAYLTAKEDLGELYNWSGALPTVIWTLLGFFFIGVLAFWLIMMLGYLMIIGRISREAARLTLGWAICVSAIGITVLNLIQIVRTDTDTPWLAVAAVAFCYLNGVSQLISGESAIPVNK